MNAIHFETNRSLLRKSVFLAAVLLVSVDSLVMAQAQQNLPPRPWNQCCGTAPWPMMQGYRGRGMMGGGMMGSSMPRHRYAMMYGLPVAYKSLTNPLPHNAKTIEQGGAIYIANCLTCHGATGAGDGAAGKSLSPPPANLQLLAQMPMVRWDSFMYWTISEGGAQFGTGMPGFKGALSDRDRWAVIAYIQARFPQKAR